MGGSADGRSAVLHESFVTDPVVGGRFTSQTSGTESTFVHLAEAGRLRALLDVDAATASYLSMPFEAVTDREALSFSFVFRVEAVDGRVPPTSFVGLMTPQHVEHFGDGLTVNLATTAGRLVATASMDAAGVKVEGPEIALEVGTEYLAAAAYSPLRRTLTVDVYAGLDFTVRAGRSEAVLPEDRRLRLTHLGLQNGGARTVDSAVGSLTLTVDELAIPGRPPVTLMAEAVEVTEGTDGASVAGVQVLLSAPSGAPVSVEYETTDGTAVAGRDYGATVGTLVIPAGASGGRIAVPVVPDSLAEGDETLEVVFRQPVNAQLGVGRVTITLRDDDEPWLELGEAEALEGDAGVVTAQVPVRMSNPSAFPVEVRFAMEEATATGGVDYEASQGTLVMAPGESGGTIAVRVLGDALAEGNETFRVRLSQPVNARLGTAEGVVTILDDDASPIVDASDATVVEGDAGPVTAVVTVRLSHPSAQPVSVGFGTVDDSATAGADYLGANGVLTFPPGVVERTVAVTVLGDTREEGAETFRVVLREPTQALLGRELAAVSIVDDDQAPALSVGDGTVNEGPSGRETALAFEVRLWPPASLPVTVNFATVGATAAAGVDFISASGSLSFPVGVTNRTVTVMVTGDDEAEPDEAFLVRLSQPLNAGLARGEGQGTILTDDSVTLSVEGQEGWEEGDGVDVQAVFRVSLRGQPIQPVTVAYFTADGTARAGLDYRAAAGLLVFEPGQTTLAVSIPLIGDFEDEPTEDFELRLHSPVGASLSRAAGTGRILDNDPPSLSVGNILVVEGSDGPTQARVAVRMSSPSSEEVRVEFVTAERTATAGVDFLPVSGVLTFPAGTRERFIDVTVVGDTLHEGDEVLVVRLVRPVGVTLAVPEALVTIRDDDPAPVIHIDDREITECSDGTASVLFAVTLSAPSAVPVTVEYWTLDDTAVAGEDYVAVRGTVVFPPGVTEMWIEVPLICDTKDEANESFGVGLGGGSGGFVGGEGRGRGGIVDDDPPQVSVADVALDEGDEGLVEARFRVTLSSPSADEVAVEFFTADETATAGTDYATVSGKVLFAPGSVVREVGVPVLGDTLPEGDETFFVGLAHPLHANLGTAQARATLRDDDQPAIRAEDVTGVEGHRGRSVVGVPVRLSRTRAETVEVSYETADETARAGEDYEAVTGVLRFAPGEALAEIPLVLLGDERIEGNETFRVRFRNPIRGTLADDEARVTVVDDDGAPVLTVADVPIDEGQAGARSLVFSLRLSAASAVPVSVRYATADVTAAAGSDYVGRSGTLSFAPGVTNQTVAIPVVGDTLFEPDETFLLVLTEPAQVVLARSQALGLIRNDDLPSVVAAEDGSVVEGPPGGGVTLTFRVTLQPPNAAPVSIPFLVHPGTATPGADFEPVSGTVVFPAGSVEQGVSVRVLGDADTEGNETVFLRLGTPSGATLGRGEAVGTIIDDEGIEIRIADAEAVESDVGSVGMFFEVSLARPGTQLITVDYATADGTAVAGQDYGAAAGTLFFPPGLLRQTLTVSVSGDAQDEPDERFEVRLSSPVNGVLERAVGVGTVRDNDPPAVSIDDVTVVGSQTGAVDAIFTVRLSSPTAESVNVAFRTENGTATAGTDYSEAAAGLVFSPGQVLRTVAIQVKGNTLDEETEYFLVHLVEPVNATPGRMTGRGTILNRVVLNQPPQVAIVTPVDGATWVAPVSVTVGATAVDSEGPVAGVEFFAGTMSLGTDSDAPYAAVWADVPAGVHTLTARATDGGGLVTTSAPVRISIALPNRPPTLEPPPSGSTLEDTPTAPLVLRVGDLDAPAALLQLDVASLTPELVVSSGVRLGGEGESRSLTLTPVTNQFGTATVQLTVRDGGGLSVTQRVDVVVLPVNDAPTLDPLPNVSVPEDASPRTIALSGIGSGAVNETQALMVTATSSHPSLVPAPAVTYSSPQSRATLTFQPRPDSQGTAILTVTVRDDGGVARGGVDTVVRQFTVTVTPENDPPTIDWVFPEEGAAFAAGSTIALGAAASDPDDGVAQVEFLLGNQVLGQAVRPPYQIDWAQVPSGEHRLVARARDFAGATVDTVPRTLRVVEPVRDLPAGDILIVRNRPDPEIEWLERSLKESFIEVRDTGDGLPRPPVVVVADREDLDLERLLGFQVIIWNDVGQGQPTVGDREIEMLWHAWEFGIPMYFIGEDLALAGTQGSVLTRPLWTQLTGLVPGGASVGPGTVVASEPRARASELFWGSLEETRRTIIDDFGYDERTLVGRLVGDGEVRATLAGEPVLTRYPAFNSPFDNAARRLVQNFLVTGPPSASLGARQMLFLNGVVWLLGGECDNFFTTPDGMVIPPETAAGPCAPHTLRAIVANNGRCQARGVMVTNVAPAGFEIVDVRIRSRPEGVNGGVAFRRGAETVFALGRVEADTEVIVEVDVVPSGPGPFESEFRSRAHYREPVLTRVTGMAEDGGCTRPRLEVRLGLSGVPEFRIAEPAFGTLKVEVSEDLIRWIPAGSATAGSWMPVAALTGGWNRVGTSLFIRVSP